MNLSVQQGEALVARKKALSPFAPVDDVLAIMRDEFTRDHGVRGGILVTPNFSKIKASVIANRLEFGEIDERIRKIWSSQNIRYAAQWKALHQEDIFEGVHPISKALFDMVNRTISHVRSSPDLKKEFGGSRSPSSGFAPHIFPACSLEALMYAEKALKAEAPSELWDEVRKANPDIGYFKIRVDDAMIALHRPALIAKKIYSRESMNDFINAGVGMQCTLAHTFRAAAEHERPPGRPLPEARLNETNWQTRTAKEVDVGFHIELTPEGMNALCETFTGSAIDRILKRMEIMIWNARDVDNLLEAMPSPASK